jgi:hypothetical protein
LKLQNKFLTLKSSSQWNTVAAIGDMKSQLEATLGASMSQTIGDIITNMHGFLDENFN